MERNKHHIATLLEQIHQSGKKAVALLIDPEKSTNSEKLRKLVLKATEEKVDFFFVGGSLLTENNVSKTIRVIKEVSTAIPVLLFPGQGIQVSEQADGILFLSLISGRNPDLLIGQHVAIAPILSRSQLEVLPTGYMLVNDGEITSAVYMSQTIPLPNSKPALAVATALAGTFLGMKYLFLDAGSGAKQCVSEKIIHEIRQNTDCPLIVGGGVDSLEKAKNAWNAGADLIVLGNGVEKNPGLLTEVLDYAHVYNLSLHVN